MFAKHAITTTFGALVMMAGLTFPAATAEAGHNACSTRTRGHVSRSGFGVHSGSHYNSHRSHSSYHHSRRYVSGYYKTVTTKVLVSAGHYDKVYHPAEYGTQFDAYGNACRVVIRPAHYDKVWHPAEYRYVTRRVWVPGCYR